MTDELLFCALELGEQLLATGAEVYRVENTVKLICSAYGCKRADVYATTSNMIVTVVNNDGSTLTQTRRVTLKSTDIERLDALNSLSRYITAERPSAKIIKEKLKQIEAVKKYPLCMIVISYAVIAGAFTLFYGSRSFLEIIISFLIGGSVGALSIYLERLGMQKPFSKLICSFLSCSVALGSVKFGWISSADLVIIGNVMSLIPGIGLTNALRDIFTGDVISGILRTIEALLLGAVIAFGYVAAAFLLS